MSLAGDPRLPAAELNELGAMGVAPESLVQRFRDNRHLRVGSEDVKKLRAINANEALQAFRAHRDDVQQTENGPVMAESCLPSMAAALASVMPENLSDVLEKAELAGFDAFDLQLKARGLWKRGEGAQLINSIFTTDNRALYPEYVRRIMIEYPFANPMWAKVAEIVSAVETIVGGSMIAPVVTDTSGSVQKRGKVGEGAGMRRATLATSTKTVVLTKDGVILEISYEAARRYSLNLLDVFISRQSIQYQNDRLLRAINIAFASCYDGGSTAAAGKFTPKDLWEEVMGRLDAGYDVSTVLLPLAMMLKYGDNPEVWDPRNLNMFLEGRINRTVGVNLKMIPSTTDASTTYALLQDRARNLICAQEAGSDIAENALKIEDQKHIYTFSMNEGFLRMDDNAMTKLLLAS